MENMELRLRMIVDSGSTKTDWLVGCEDGQFVCRCSTQGINPFHQSESDIAGIVERELMPQLSAELAKAGLDQHQIGSIRFYGAGCRGEAIGQLHNVLTLRFPSASEILVGSDLLAAAHAVCGDSEGIACILGTGANSGLYDGREIVSNVSPLGYILGDEGSGAVLGKLFVNGMFKGDIPAEVREEFLATTGQSLDDIIRRVYREPMANRYLASLSPFIHAHLECKEFSELVVRNFMDFFRLNVDHYGRNDLPVGAVGSVAFYYKDQLAEAAHRCGYTLGKIMAKPFESVFRF